MTTAPTDPTRTRSAQWLVTAFATGAVVMSLELVAFRLYAPHFGYSTYVWGSMIGVVMVALSAGYAIGGWAADRSRSDGALYAMLLASGVWQAAILTVISPLMTRFGRMDAMVGPLVATLVIFAPPMTLLATTGPFVTRLTARRAHVGAAAGNVYAISTAGSIVGVFGTSFGLVPWVGTRTTLVTACVVSLAIGASGLALRRSIVSAIAIVPIAAALRTPALEWTASAVWMRESTYNLVRVIRHGDEFVLALNDARTAQSFSSGPKRWTGRYHDFFALGPLLVPTHEVLLLGMGAGTSIETTRIAAPTADFDAVEIDPLVVEAAQRFFGIHPAANLRVHIADARTWVRSTARHYDLVELDLFQGGLYQPFYLVTEEAFRGVAHCLAEGGAVAMNVYDGSPRETLLSSIAATLRRVFPSVASVHAGRRNHIVFAFARRRTLRELQAQLNAVTATAELRDLALEAAADIRELSPPPGTIAFSDDRAPVEALTRAMLAESPPTLAR